MTTNAPGAFSAPYLATSRSFPTASEELSTTLVKSWSEIASVVNRRSIGTYFQLQSVTGNLYFPLSTGVNSAIPLNPRQSYRQVYTLAALPNSMTADIATGITPIANATFVNIYGVAQKNGATAVALMPWDMTMTDDAPYLRVNLSTGNIEVITNSANWTAYSGIIVLEYLLS